MNEQAQGDLSYCYPVGCPESRNGRHHAMHMRWGPLRWWRCHMCGRRFWRYHDA